MRFTYFAAVLCVAWATLAVAEPWFANAGINGKEINVQLANEMIPLNTKAATVGEFLRELSIELPKGSQVDPPQDSILRDGMTLNLQKLSVTRGQTERVIPIEVEFSECWHCGPENFSLVDPGQEGLVESTCTIFYSNGVEVGRRQREDEIRAMRPKKVVHYRTLTGEDGPSVEEILKLRVAPGPHHKPPTRYKRKITMNSTAYEPSPHSCGPRATGRTACGLQAGYGVVAVDTNYIPFGTRMFIEGYGYAVAGDRGGAIDGYDIDLGFLTISECYAWGRKKVNVYILY
jgi:3D (Asp-Asp-Asp) domain-containing protein